MSTVAEYLEIGENVKLPLRSCRLTPDQWGLKAEGYLAKFYAQCLNHALMLTYNRCETEQEFLENFLFTVNVSYSQQIKKESYSDVQKLIDTIAAYLYRGVIIEPEQADETPPAIYYSDPTKLPLSDRSLRERIKASLFKRYVTA